MSDRDGQISLEGVGVSSEIHWEWEEMGKRVSP